MSQQPMVGRTTKGGTAIRVLNVSSKTDATSAAAAPYRIHSSVPESSTTSMSTNPASVKTAAASSTSLEARLAALLRRQQAREVRAFGAPAPPSASAPAAPTATAATPRLAVTRKSNGGAAPRVFLTSPPPPIPLAPTSPSRSPTTGPAPPTHTNAAPLSLHLSAASGTFGKPILAPATPQDGAYPNTDNGSAYTVSNANTPARPTGSVGGVTAVRPPLTAWKSPLRGFPSMASSFSTPTYSESPLPNRSFTAFSARDSPPSHPLGPAPLLSRVCTPTGSMNAAPVSLSASPDDCRGGAAEHSQWSRTPESSAFLVHDEWSEAAVLGSTSLPDMSTPPPPPSVRNGHTAQLLQAYQARSFSASANSSAYVSPAEEDVEAMMPPPVASPPDSLTVPPALFTRNAAPLTNAVASVSKSVWRSPPQPSLPAADEALGTVSPTEASSSGDSLSPSQHGTHGVDAQRSWAVPVESRYSAVAPLPASPPQPGSLGGTSANEVRASAAHLDPVATYTVLATAPTGSRSPSHARGEAALRRPDWRDTIVAGVRVCRDSPHVGRPRCTSREGSQRTRGKAPVWSATSLGAWDRRSHSGSASTDREASIASAPPAAPTATLPSFSFQQRAPEHHVPASPAQPLLSAALRPALLATTHGSRYKLLDDAAPPTNLMQAAAAVSAGPDVIAEGLHMRLVLSRLKAESVQRRLEQRLRLNSVL